MKISIFLLLFSFSAATSYSQSDLVPDSVMREICRSIIESREPNDSTRIDKAFELHLAGIFSKLDDSTASKAFSYTYYRLQKLCKEFKALLDRMYPSGGDWVALETKPATRLNKGSCREFLKHKNYYYLEESGDTVRLVLSPDSWTDHFKDGTFSRLKLNWIDDCEFVISFIESNNLTRKSFSKPGDKYNYRIIEKHDNYYLVCLEVKEVNVLGTFRIYFY